MTGAQPPRQQRDGCPAYDLRLLESAFAPVPDARLDEHLAGCARCRRARDLYLRTADALAAGLAVGEPAAVRAPARWVPRHATIWVAAATALVAAALLFWPARRAERGSLLGAKPPRAAATANTEPPRDAAEAPRVLTDPAGAPADAVAHAEVREIAPRPARRGSPGGTAPSAPAHPGRAAERQLPASDPAPGRLPPTAARGSGGSATSGAVPPETGATEREGPRLAGWVFDEDTGLGVPFVRVRLGCEGRDPRDDPATRADAGGSFVLRGLAPPHASAELILEAEGYARRVVDLSRPAPGLLASIRARTTHDLGALSLDRGTSITGRVIDSSGAPVAGAVLLRIPASHPAGEGIPLSTASLPRMATTSRDGSFRLEHVAPARQGPVEVLAVTPGGRGMGWTHLGVVRGVRRIDDVSIVLHPPTHLEVWVRDPAGHPIRGAAVTAEPVYPPFAGPRVLSIRDDRYEITQEDLRSLFMTRTDAEGYAVLDGLPFDAEARAYRVHVAAEGYVSTTRPAEGWIEPHPGTTIPVTLTPYRACSVSGRVLTAQGRPIAGARVVLTAPDARGAGNAGGVRAVHAAADGTFVLDALEPCRAFTLSAGAHAFAGASREVTTSAACDLHDVDLVLAPAAPITGRIVDVEGNPVAGAAVRLRRGEPPDGAGSDGGPAFPKDALTSRDGCFDFPDAAPGDWNLVAHLPPAEGPWESSVLRRTVRGGDAFVELLASRLAPGETRLDVELHERTSGRPLVPVEVSLQAPRTCRRVPVERSLGLVSATHLLPGTWWLHVRFEEGHTIDRRFEIEPYETRVRERLEVDPPGAIEGRVELPLWPPPEDLRIRAVPADSPPGSSPPFPRASRVARLSPQGTFRIAGLSPGRVVLRLLGEGWRGEAEAVVAPGATTSVELVGTRSRDL